MFERLGRVIVQRKARVLAIFLITFIGAGAIGSLAFGRLDSGGYTNPNSESAKAYKYLQENFNIEDPAVVLVVDSGITKSFQEVQWENQHGSQSHHDC